MRVADEVSVECLRRTSHIFLQLFSKARPSQANKRIYSWPRPHASFLDPSQRRELLAFLAKDSYCSDCLAARGASDWQTRVTLTTERYLHCSACDLDHPACLFTPEQRINFQHSRVCIGHEGHIRLCEHKTVPWRQIQLLAQDMQEQGKRPDWELVTQCEDESHLQFCEWGALKGQSGTLPNRNWKANTTRHPALFAGYGDKNDGFRLLLSWSAHLSLRKASGAPLTPESLTDGLARLRRKATGFICPELERGQVVESWLFDPNGCGCLDYKALDQLGVGWGWSRNAKSKRARECQGGGTLPLQPLIQAQRPEARRSPRGHDKLGNKSKHRGDLESNLAKGGPAEGFTQRVTAVPCKGGAECLQLRYVSMARLDGKDGHLRRMVSNWYLLLDPQSYKVTQDRDGFRVYWCEDKRCRNYWQYARSRWRPFLSAEDYTRACPH